MPPKDQDKPSGPVKTKKYIVEVDRDLCIGAATCVAIAPKSFALDNEAKAIILETVNDEEFGTLLAGAKSCPVEAIIIKDENGKQIYPR